MEEFRTAHRNHRTADTHLLGLNLVFMIVDVNEIVLCLVLTLIDVLFATTANAEAG